MYHTSVNLLIFSVEAESDMTQLLLDPDRRTASDCPQCETQTVNVQGIRTCSACNWIEC